MHSLIINTKSKYTKHLLEQNSYDMTWIWKALKRVYLPKNTDCQVEISFNGKVERRKDRIEGSFQIPIILYRGSAYGLVVPLTT